MEENNTVSFGKSFFIGVLIVAIMLLIAYFINSYDYKTGGFETTETTETTEETTYQITEETTTETTTIACLNIGDSGIISNSQITLNDIGYNTILYDDSGYYRMTAKDNCQYVLVYVTIKNIGKAITSFRWIDNDFYCKLYTSDGLEYSPTSFFPYINDSLENMSLNPLEEKSGFVGFSVPNEVINSNRELYLVCDGYPDEIKFKVK